MRAPYVYVFDGNNYILKNLNDILDDVIMYRADDVSTLYKMNTKKMTNTQQKSIQGLLKQIKENNIDKINEDKKEIKIAMYNNKFSIKKLK